MFLNYIEAAAVETTNLILFNPYSVTQKEPKFLSFKFGLKNNNKLLLGSSSGCQILSAIWILCLHWSSYKIRVRVLVKMERAVTFPLAPAVWLCAGHLSVGAFDSLICKATSSVRFSRECNACLSALKVCTCLNMTGRSDSVPTGLFFPEFLESLFKAADLFPWYRISPHEYCLLNQAKQAFPVYF